MHTNFKQGSMKTRILFLLSALFISFASCSGTTDKDNGNTVSTPKEGVVNQMNDVMFQKLIWNYKNSTQDWKFLGDQPAIIDFYADWCRPCKMVAPIMDDLAKEYQGKIRFFRINTDQERELAGLFRVNSIPALLFIPKEGKPQMTVGAQSRENYVQAINQILIKK